MRRAGLDYREFVDLKTWPSLKQFIDDVQPGRVFACSTKGKMYYSDARYEKNDALVFGPETRGLPQEVLDSLPPEQVLRIPMLPESRSLNLSNSVAIIVYEAWRQLGFETPDC